MDAYFDCFSGISGDMILGALIDVGVPTSWLKQKIASLPISEKKIDILTEKKTVQGIKATNFNVVCSDKNCSRNLTKIAEIIKESKLSKNSKQKSMEVFHHIASAESKIHRCPIDKINFHEIGGIDSIIDIVGSIICLEYLEIENVFSSEIPLGKGFVKCSHGKIPIPSPATLEILKGVPVYGTKINRELVTPTGAGILVSLAKSFGNMPHILTEKVGYGCGKNNIKNHPNLLRIITGRSFSPKKNELALMIETNIDDMNPELYSFLVEKLFDIGALDVAIIPTSMKKGRPGIKLEIISPKHLKNIIIENIFSQTTSLGVRYYQVEREILERSSSVINTELGLIKVKSSKQQDGTIRYLPEYKICKDIATKKNLPLREVYEAITRATPPIKQKYK